MTEVVLSPGVIVEHVGGELLVVVPGHTDVVKLTGGVAQVLEDIRSGSAVDLSDPAVADLLELGIVSTPGVSRRGLIKAGAIGAGAGVAVLAMPSVAAASSLPTFEVSGRTQVVQDANNDFGVRFSIDQGEFPGSQFPDGEPGPLLGTSLGDVPFDLINPGGGLLGPSAQWFILTNANAGPDNGTFIWGGMNFLATFT